MDDSGRNKNKTHAAKENQGQKPLTVLYYPYLTLTYILVFFRVF